MSQGSTRLRRGVGSPTQYAVLAAIVAALILASLVSAGSPVHATTGKNPYVTPKAVDTNPKKNVFETTLTAQQANVDIGNGVTAHAQTFNGTVPGPTFHLHVGETVIVHFKNHLNSVAGIHWHGIEVPNESDGTPFVQNQVEPGGSFLYEFKVNRPGIYWYHPHHHASTNQVFKGLSGMIIVKDPNEKKLDKRRVLPSAQNTREMVLNDTTVCKAQGQNDAATYSPAAPWVGGGALPAQGPPTPKNLCEGPSLPGPTGGPYPIDENGSLRAAFSAGDIPNIQTAAHAGRVNEGQTVLTNGMNVGARAGTPSAPGPLASGASVSKIRPGAGLRMELLNASAVRYMRLRLTDSAGTQIPLVRVGGEGGLLNYALTEGGTQGAFDTKYDPGEILLPPGSRADVVAAIPSSASGVATMWTEDYQRTGNGYSDIPTVPVAHFRVTGNPAPVQFHITGGSGDPGTPPAGTKLRAQTGHPVQPLGAPTNTILIPANFSPTKPGTSDENIRLTQNAQVDLGIDNVFGTHDTPGDYMLAPHLASSRYVFPGARLQLSVQNQTGSNHPYHLHGFSIQPLSLTKSGGPNYTWLYPEYRDNVDVPAGYTLNFRMQVDPRAMMDGKTPGGAYGRWLLHCHIFFHATDGMLSELVVVQSSGNERPNVNVKKATLPVKAGKRAKMTGTFGDPDGNLVKLSASEGKVKETGSGSYRWTEKTGRKSRSHLVYINAKDSHGLKGQIAFQLKVRGH